MDMQQCLHAVNGRRPMMTHYRERTTAYPFEYFPTGTPGKPDVDDYDQDHVCPQYENWPHGREIMEMCRPHYGKPEPKGGTFLQ